MSAAFIQPLLDAVAHHEAGRLEAAESGYAAVLELEPEQPQALFFAGVLASKSGRTGEAVTLLRRAVQARPEHAESQFALGNALWDSGSKEEARAAWEQTLRSARRHVGALLNLARAQGDAGDLVAAVATCRTAVAAAPNGALPQAALAAALLAAADPEAALEAADAALALDPASHDGHFQRGTALRRLGRLGEARTALEAAVRLAPDHAPAQLNLANTLHDLRDPAGAEHHCRAAIAADPAMAEAYSVLGFLLTETGHLSEAICACTDAVRLQPDLAEAQWNLGIALLSAGDLPGGFARYEWRKRHPAYAKQFVSLPEPEWDGGALAGKRLLVLAEQGLGDAIMFARYAAPLAAHGATVTLACDRRLVPLLKTAPGLADAVPKDGPLPPFDLWVDQMSLPLLCGTTIRTVPQPACYLTADPARVALWRARLPCRTAATWRVGFAWAGNPLHSNDANRSCPAAALAPLTLRPGIHAVSLQVGPAAAEAASLGMDDLSPDLTDYAETAALVANLDIVVTVDTSVAHLAAAMGKPTWIMLPHCPDWRWLRDRTDSPWYGSVRLFRQPHPGDWQSVISASPAPSNP